MVRLAASATVLAVALAGAAQAGNLVTNGGFEATTNGGGQLGFNTAATGWSTGGYNFLFASGSADTTGVTGSYGNLKLWGPGTGSNNGLPASSPDGGNYVAADGAFGVGAITQTINGLTVNLPTALTFYWAGAQQYTFTGPTTEQWQVSLGTQTQTTAVVSNLNHGFTGWTQETMTFVPTSVSEVLSFLAVGTPGGVPPFSLLDGVSLSAVPVPEPASLAVLAVGLVGIGGLLRLRRKRASNAAA